MKRALLLVLIAAANVLPAPVSNAGAFTDDVYRSRFLARDRAERTYSIDATVEDRPAGALLVLEIRRQCRSCRADVYAKTLKPGDLVVRYTSPGAECQCMFATVEAKFGGRPLRIDWVWDPEQGVAPADGGLQWTAVTANNLMNVSCFGSGTLTSTPQPLAGDAPEPPRGARDFPKEMPPGFKADPLAGPSCDVESP